MRRYLGLLRCNIAILQMGATIRVAELQKNDARAKPQIDFATHRPKTAVLR
jgi:hypothetical protein